MGCFFGHKWKAKQRRRGVLESQWAWSRNVASEDVVMGIDICERCGKIRGWSKTLGGRTEVVDPSFIDPDIEGKR